MEPSNRQKRPAAAHFGRLGLVALASLAIVATGFSAAAQAIGERSEKEVWPTLIRPGVFGDREILEGDDVIELRVPLRAEDSGVVPVSVNAKIQQTPERYIETVYVFIDRNPRPLAGTFHLTPEMGRADLAMRLRVDQVSHVRAVAELNNGELHMHKGFTRASGGCSEPPPFLELKQAREQIGQMRLKVRPAAMEGNPALAQLSIRHPNITGLQLDQRTRTYIPAEYVTEVKISFNDTHVMTAETDISISEDPSFRFFFRPDGPGTITAEMTDSKGRNFVRSFDVAP
jgi:sulfur-oxidizing protein SoxY